MNNKILLNERYEIKEILGRGGFATTYLAVDTETEQKCAVKCLSFRKIEEWKTWELFEREAKILKNLDHPKIPDYIDFFTIETEQGVELYLVQEYVEGKSLTQLTQDGRHFTEKEAITVALKMCRILEYLHSFSPPIIHRDIKPNNITLNPDDRLHLIDFGAVKDTMLTDYSKSTGVPTVVGTYGYMPLEQIEGRAQPCSDLYALGMTLIYLLSHTEPTEMDKKGLQLGFRKYVNISDRFARILDKMIAPDWTKRYQSAAEVKQDLKDLLAARPWAKLPSLPKWLAAVLVLMLIFFGASYYFFFATAPIVTPVSTPTPVLPTPTLQPTIEAIQPVNAVNTPTPTPAPFLTPTPTPTPTVSSRPSPTPTPLPPLSIRGRLLFDGQPITDFTSLEAKFWLGNEDTGQEPGAYVTYENGSFFIYGLPSGKFVLTVEINANTMNSRLYPGDFRAARVFDFMGRDNSELILDMGKIIHLTSPQDNDAVMEGENRNCLKMSTHQNQLKFEWMPLGENVDYKYKIIRYNCSTYDQIEEIVAEKTKETNVTIPLKPNQPNEYYGFSLYAHKNDRPIGSLMIHHLSNGVPGEGNEYRFRVK